MKTKKMIGGAVALVVLVLGLMWLYGFIKVKCEWVDSMGEIASLNPISKSGAKAAMSDSQIEQLEMVEQFKNGLGL